VLYVLLVDVNFIADAAAEELRNRLIQLSRQLVDLQVLVAQKDAQLTHLSQHKATLEARLASSGITGVAAAGGRRGVDYVSREQHEQLADEAAGLKEQLVECLEELDARERELGEVGLVLQLNASCLLLWVDAGRYGCMAG
jgi:hypothetical protein